MLPDAKSRPIATSVLVRRRARNEDVPIEHDSIHTREQKRARSGPFPLVRGSSEDLQRLIDSMISEKLGYVVPS